MREDTTINLLMWQITDSNNRYCYKVILFVS